MRGFRRCCGRQDGQTTTEYIVVLALVGLIIAALVSTQPGIRQLAGTTVRSAVCNLFGGCGDGPTVAGDPDGEKPGGDSLWDRVTAPIAAVGEQGWQLLEGAGSQAWDEVKGIGDTAAWAWRTATSAEQRRENGRTWDAIRSDPLGAAGSVLSGIWAPIQQEIDAGRPAAAVGRGAFSVLSVVFGGKGATKLNRLRPDLDDVDDAARRARRIDCVPNSFLPSTPVLLADGSRVPIAAVDVGDLVLAADPETGQVAARAVTDLIVGSGDKDLVEVTIDGATITATDRHPFFLAHERRWVDADELRAGDALLTPAGTTVRVGRSAAHRASATVHNLTVADLHTYFVAAGPEAVLVHNASSGCIDESASAFTPRERQAAEIFANEGRTVEAVPVGSGRTPDALVDGVPWEIKSLDPGASNTTVRNALNSAKGQAPNALVDARGSGITQAEAQRGLDRFLGANPGRMDSVRIVGDGWEITWPPP